MKRGLFTVHFSILRPTFTPTKKTKTSKLKRCVLLSYLLALFSQTLQTLKFDLLMLIRGIMNSFLRLNYMLLSQSSTY